MTFHTAPVITNQRMGLVLAWNGFTFFQFA